MTRHADDGRLGFARRDFLRAGALSAAALGAPIPALARRTIREHLIPEDKAFDETWLRTLLERGEPSSYSGDDLRFIGMPVGGICAGQVHLGGDGRLGHWDVLNTPNPDDLGQSAGKHYAEPRAFATRVPLGFAVRIAGTGATQLRTLDSGGFVDVTFRGEYPIGYVDYSDVDSPVNVALEAFSPFIPLDANDSGLPATILRFKVTNTSDQPVRVSIGGYLENVVGHSQRETHIGERRNRILRDDHATTLLGYAAAKSKFSREDGRAFENSPDFGTQALALVGVVEDDFATAELDAMSSPPNALFSENAAKDSAATALEDRIFGALGRHIELKPGNAATVVFVTAWFFPNAPLRQLEHVTNIANLKRHYAKRFQSAVQVTEYAVRNMESLVADTHLWHDTWYDSTLPYWFLDRTFANVATLATSTCTRFDNGRFYGWDSLYSGVGTCTHVWHYAQAPARLFPELERSLRERVDYDIAFHEDTGAIDCRAEASQRVAVDGQAGVILRMYREHTMSADDAFLRRSWTRVRRSAEYLIRCDTDKNGILNGAQYNTLEATWHGKVPWLSSLYLAALHAAQAMATELGDEELIEQCQAILHVGHRRLGQEAWNGEYYIQEPDPQNPVGTNPGIGCHSEQVHGQGWAFQVGLRRILPQQTTRSALAAIWKYNFAPDVGPYRDGFEAIPGGRWQALPGESGLVMCTWPRGGADKVAGENSEPSRVAYFNECWTGLEYQVAAHMLWEGLAREGFAITRAVHDRYHPSKRNPWNEIEASDHAARAMASYGVFLAACGFEVHGPKGHLGFAPRVTPEKFRAAFVAPECWGTYEQERDRGVLRARVHVRWGRLRLESLALQLPVGARASEGRMSSGEDDHAITLRQAGDRVELRLAQALVLTPGDTLAAEVVA